MLRGSRGKDVQRHLNIEDRSQKVPAALQWKSGIPTKNRMRQAAYGVHDKISMQGRRTPRLSEGLA